MRKADTLPNLGLLRKCGFFEGILTFKLSTRWLSGFQLNFKLFFIYNNNSLMLLIGFNTKHVCFLGHFSYVNSVEFHPSGTCIAAGGTDSTVKVCLNVVDWIHLSGELLHRRC